MKVTTQTVIQIFPSKPGFLGYRGDVEGKGNIADREGGRGRSGGGVWKVVGLKWGEQSGGLIREGVKVHWEYGVRVKWDPLNVFECFE